MERNIVTDAVVPESTLEDAEMYAVGVDGAKVAAAGDFVYGIVRTGRPANEASEIITMGECEAYCTTIGGGNISAEDPLTGGANGMLQKATIGTHHIRAVALEAVTSVTTAQVLLL